jgi:phosphoglycolate phosphatase
MAMARAAGASGIGVTWGYHPRTALESAGAVAVIDRFEKLVPTLDSIWAA